MKQLEYRVYYIRYEVLLYLWQIKSIQKCGIVSTIVWKFFSFALYIFHNDSDLLNSPTLAKKREFYLKSTSNQIWRLPKVHFWSEPSMRNSIHRKLLNLELSRNTLGLYLRKNLKRGSEVTKTGNHIKKQLGSSKEIKLNSTNQETLTLFSQ